MLMAEYVTDTYQVLLPEEGGARQLIVMGIIR